MKEIFANPGIARHIVDCFTAEEAKALEDEFKESAWSFCFNALYNPAACLPEQVQELFNLYPKRTQGKHSYHYGIYRAEEQEFAEVPATPQKNKLTAGFLVTIPVPYKLEYGRGSDRHPITLIRKYITAIHLLNFQNSKSQPDMQTDEQALFYARKQIRIIICLNIEDDPYNSKQTTYLNWLQVTKFAKSINRQLTDLYYPAWVIPCLWGIDQYNGQRIYLESNEINWMNSEADKLRSYFRILDNINNKKCVVVHHPFPFARVRSFMLQSKTAENMIQSLLGYNKNVFVKTADADLISLHPVNKSYSIFSSILQTISLVNKSNPDVMICRMGGGYFFDNSDIAQHINQHLSKNNKTISGLHLSQSVLMTQLLRAIDIATRKVFSLVDDSLAYYSEANTFSAHEIFDAKHFVYQGQPGSPNHKKPLLRVLANDSLSEPDITAQMTRSIIQKKNWVVQDKVRRQYFLVNDHALLLTSARHDLVIVTDYKEVKNVPTPSGSSQVVHLHQAGPDSLKKMLANQHNNQATASQLNSRFSECGFGDNVFKHDINILGIKQFPYVIYFLSSTRVPNGKNSDKDAALGGIVNNRIQDALKEIKAKLPAAKKAKNPRQLEFNWILHEIRLLFENVKKLYEHAPVLEVTELQFRPKFLKACYVMNIMLRNAVILMLQINDLVKPYQIVVKNIVESQKQTLFIYHPAVPAESQEVIDVEAYLSQIMNS